jgi:putative addiction module component (TIGR02574 family)
MQRHPADVLRDALALTPEARAALVDSLVDSLDPDTDEGAGEPWQDEIRLRLQQIDTGAVELTPWAFARVRLRGRLER